ncbi:XdhC family protein [Streptomyces sp. MNU89]|uniref:XdhC family protein n=1 Tax=Streptomyces sp. MNU89 TaxID=2560025 RepID=UPI001E5BD296|nr:XdhC/CoxI family protein [Streptomyces sp. MNU89]MCC9742819.1 XdhC family protein [Streptomyces sp. MNU89]
MRDVVEDLERWWRAGETVGVATVVATWRSSPRQPGATMLVGPGGTAVGSVSGGCVEAAVHELASDVAAGAPPLLQSYGVADDDAFAVGLTCGGTVELFVERVDRTTFPELGEAAEAIRAGEPVAVVTCVAAARTGGSAARPDGSPGGGPDAGPGDGPDPEGRLGRHLVVGPGRVTGSLGSPGLDAAVTADVRAMLAAGRGGTLRYGYDGRCPGEEVRLFVAVHAAPPRLIVFGAVDFAAALARIGVFLGHRVTVCDARPVFATRRRFPEADEVVVDWPDRYLRAEAAAGRTDARTAVCVLTHDPKFDVPVLETALRLPLAYVGAMGSRRTHRDRLGRLRAAGLTEPELARLASPIGLDLGARTPEETAVSIAAEIIADRAGATGSRLSGLTGSIHAAEPEPGPTPVAAVSPPVSAHAPAAGPLPVPQGRPGPGTGPRS